MQRLPDSRTYVIDGPRQLIGWGMVAELPGDNHAMFFVNPRFRGRGMARRLVARILRDYPALLLTHWNFPTKDLFERWETEWPGRVRVVSWNWLRAEEALAEAVRLLALKEGV